LIDFISVIGLFLGVFFLILGYSMDGGSITLLWLLSAVFIVFGGSLGATLLSYGFEQVKMLPKLMLDIFIAPKSNIKKTVDYIIELSDKARKDGLLSLEKAIQEGKNDADPFLKKGILMVIDGTDPDEIRDVLESEISITEKKKLAAIGMFDSMAAYAPACGMIGTLMGLILLLQDMSSVEQLTKSIAVAFVCTLYGTVAANILFIPFSRKLKIRLEDYRLKNEMIIDGICTIRNSVNPRMLKDKLSMYQQK
jgi:chemotaxis protein MotA